MCHSEVPGPQQSPYSDILTIPTTTTRNFLPHTHGSLEWTGGVATWSSRDGWSGDTRPDAEWLQ
jgi:hypothetical protein